MAISRFRKRPVKAFAALFTQGLGLCAHARLVSLGRVALDGSKVRAEGGLAAEVQALLADAERTDAAEDAVHGDRRGDELPAELARRAGRLASVRAKVNHPFLIVKRDFGFTKTRYRGMAKNLNHLNVLFASANWVMRDRAVALMG